MKIYGFRVLAIVALAFLFLPAWSGNGTSSSRKGQVRKESEQKPFEHILQERERLAIAELQRYQQENPSTYMLYQEKSGRLPRKKSAKNAQNLNYYQ